MVAQPPIIPSQPAVWLLEHRGGGGNAEVRGPAPFSEDGRDSHEIGRHERERPPVKGVQSRPCVWGAGFRVELPLHLPQNASGFLEGTARCRETVLERELHAPSNECIKKNLFLARSVVTYDVWVVYVWWQCGCWAHALCSRGRKGSGVGLRFPVFWFRVSRFGGWGLVLRV